MIPKIIHQIWEGRKEPLPAFYKKLGESWKQFHPGWKYEYWDGDRMEAFVNSEYPHLAEMYFNYKYDVLRWDVIRYLILYKMGGMYVDFDYDCMDAFDSHLSQDKCHFAMEPEPHRRALGKSVCFNNALMVTPPFQPFLERVVMHLQTTPITYTGSKFRDVLIATGPLMLTNLYETFEDKTDIHLFPPELVSPWSKNEVQGYMNGRADKQALEKKLGNAIAIHYFWGSWLDSDV